MKTNNNTQNETRNALVNAIKAGSHEENALCVASGMVNEYPEYCEALWQLQRDGVIYYNNGGYYLTDESETNEAADRMEADHAARDIIARRGLQGIQADREKHRERTRAKVADERRPLNVLALPIVRDYRDNRHHLRRVCADRLDFSGRNHWAKDDRDRRVLAILAAHFNK